jgi:hypothetical protein
MHIVIPMVRGCGIPFLLLENLKNHSPTMSSSDYKYMHTISWHDVGIQQIAQRDMNLLRPLQLTNMKAQ